MRSFTLFYLLCFGFSCFAQNSDSIIFAHGTFTYFAKCKDGIICVSDSRVTETRRNSFGESKLYTDKNSKIYNHDGVIFAFSNQLNIGNQKIWDLLVGFSMPYRLQNNILKDFYSRLISSDGGDTYIKNGNIFIAGMSEKGELFFCRSFLENKSLITSNTDEKYLTNRTDYETMINFNLLTMDEAFEIIQEEIQTYSFNVEEIGGKLIGFKIYNNGTVQSIDNGKTISHINSTEDLTHSRVINFQNSPQADIYPFIGGQLDFSLLRIDQHNQPSIENLDKNTISECSFNKNFSFSYVPKIADFSNFILKDDNSLRQNLWEPYIYNTYPNSPNWFSTSVLNLCGINVSKLTIDPITTNIDFSKCKFLYESTLPFNISPVLFTQINENSIVKSAIISN